MRLSRIGILAVIIIVIAVMVSALVAQDACPADLSCPTLQLPEGFTGDFYLGDTPLATGQNAAALQVPPGAQTLIVRNIQSSDPNFNQLFVYQEASVRVSLRAGQSRTFPVKTKQQFIRGTLNFTCQIANRVDGENVACSVSIDGVYRTDVAVGESADFIVDPGGRAVSVQVVGEHAWLWASAVWQGNVNVTAGRTARARSQFAKLGHLVITLNQAGAVGDIYVNGELLASQVASADKWVAPGSYSVEIKNINDLAAGGVYRWVDASVSSTARAGRDSAVTARLKKELLPTPVAAQIQSQTATCDCSGDHLNCSNFSRQSEAQACHNYCIATVGRDINRLDGRDQDGIACESLP